jgi:predicted SnoaL-like aldol condensation-catalyzing enzyme
MLRLLAAAVLIALAPAAYAADARQIEENKKSVQEFYEAAINQKDFDAAVKFVGPRYVRHNPRAADGPEGLKAFLAFLREKLPDYHSEIKRVFADGDYVILHVHNVPTAGSRGNAIVDIFKLRTARSSSIGTCVRRFPSKPPIQTRCSSLEVSCGCRRQGRRAWRGPDRNRRRCRSRGGRRGACARGSPGS